MQFPIDLSGIVKYSDDLIKHVSNRITPNGRVSYSQRLTVTARCKMNLEKFPHDSQSCPLKVTSFGHSSQEVVYKKVFKFTFKYRFSQKMSLCCWEMMMKHFLGHPVYISPKILYINNCIRWTATPATLGDIELSQYHFVGLESGSVNTSVRYQKLPV